MGTDKPIWETGTTKEKEEVINGLQKLADREQKRGNHREAQRLLDEVERLLKSIMKD